MSDYTWDEPDTDAVARSRSAALAILTAPATAANLAKFYNPSGNYAGATFQHLAPVHHNEMTASDLLAVSLMNVAVQPAAVRRILDDADNQRDLTAALQAVPPDISLANADGAALDAAARLYELIKQLLGGNKWVTASKLAARKRPLLIPVRDSVIVQNLDLDNTDFRMDWSVIRDLMKDESLTQVLASVRKAAAAQLPAVAAVPDLRLLDSALWMHGRTAAADEAEDPDE